MPGRNNANDRNDILGDKILSNERISSTLSEGQLDDIKALFGSVDENDDNYICCDDLKIFLNESFDEHPSDVELQEI